MRWYEATMGHGAWLMQLAALLLVLASFYRASRQFRVSLIAAAAVALAYGLLFGRNPASIFWSIVVLGINAIKFAQIEWGERRARFTDREEHLRGKMIPGLSRPHARALIDRGNWLSGKPGERLLTEGEPAAHLFFLHEGAALVSFAGKTVGQCVSGDLIGDATAISAAPATATVALSVPSELWCIWAEELRQYIGLHPEVRAVIERQLNDTLRAKLSGANRRLAEAG